MEAGRPLTTDGTEGTSGSQGILENVEYELIHMALQFLCNNLLERPQDTPVDFERANRVPRPRGQEHDPPDIVCCFVDYKLKEVVAHRACEQEELIFNGSAVRVFQDLSPSC